METDDTVDGDETMSVFVFTAMCAGPLMIFLPLSLPFLCGVANDRDDVNVG
jgi:hypothetical protein